MPANREILLTPPGVAAIAVVRVAGPGAIDFLRAHFLKPLSPSRTVHGILRDADGSELDDPVVVLSPDRDWADINLHGGTRVVQAVLDLARQAGFEIVERPEFPLPDDAVDSDEIIEREILKHLPLATTELALRTLLAQRRAWAELERELPTISPQRIEAIMKDDALRWLLHPPRVAIIGAANVGKSTLANQLFAQERSITADLPGTTRDWVGELANLDGLAVHLVDTPGVRQTNDPIERQAICRSEDQVQQADLVVLILDASRSIEPEQQLVERFRGAIYVINKVDAKPAWEFAAMNAIHTVATTGTGVDELRRRIRLYFGCEQIDVDAPRCSTQRQRALLRIAHAG